MSFTSFCRGSAFALFLKSQRKWSFDSLADDDITAFREAVKNHGINPAHILPHGSYLVNLGNPSQEKREKSYISFIDDLKRCDVLGIKLYNFQYVFSLFIYLFISFFNSVFPKLSKNATLFFFLHQVF